MYNSIFLDAFICLHVRLKKWDLDYDSMLQLLNISHLSVCRKFLTMYDIVSGRVFSRDVVLGGKLLLWGEKM